MDNFIHIHDTHLGKFNTVSGREINILNPTVESIDEGDIGTGLANFCRFGGQLSRHYSVAQHSILVMLLAPDHLKPAAILHDASEGYLGDVIKPLKVILGAIYGDIETRFTEVICGKYGVSLEDIKAIKPYDMQALEIEHAFLRTGSDVAWNAIWIANNMGFVSYDANPEIWKRRYLQYFYELFPAFAPVS